MHLLLLQGFHVAVTLLGIISNNSENQTDTTHPINQCLLGQSTRIWIRTSLPRPPRPIPHLHHLVLVDLGTIHPILLPLAASLAPLYLPMIHPLNLRPGTFTDPAFIGTRRTGYADAPFEQGFTTRAGIGNAGPTRTSSVDSYGLNSSIPSQPPWGSSTSVHSGSLNTRTSSYDHMGPGPFTSHLGSGLDPAYSGESSLTRGLTAQQDVLGQNFGNVNQRDLSRLGPGTCINWSITRV
jgi:hypothetical protein